MVELTEEQKRGNPLRVTRGDGIPLEDQAAAIAAFKQQALRTEHQRQVARGYFSETTGKYFHEGGVEFVCSAVVNARDYDAMVAQRDALIERLRQLGTT